MSAPAYGLAAEFDTPEALRAAALRLREAGYTRLDCFSPIPVEDLDALLSAPPSRLPVLVFAGGVLGFATAVAWQLIPSAVIYPLNLMGKPPGPLSAPAFFPIAFELTILGAAIFAFVGMFLLAGLPRLHHPMFGWDRFRAASSEKFFCVVRAADPRFSEPALTELFTAAGGRHISLVPEED